MDILQDIQTRLEEKIETLTQTKNWQWKAAFIVSVFSVLSIFSNIVPLEHYREYFKALLEHREYFAFQTVVDRAKDLSGHHTYPPLTGLNNRTFRLTIPIFVKIFHLYPASFWVYVLQLLLGIVFFKLILEKSQELIEDAVSAFYFTLALASTYVGMSFWVDFSGYSDFFSYLFLFLIIYFRSPFLILLFSQFAFWNDERAFVSAIFPFLWWWLYGDNQVKNKEVSFRPNSQMLTIVFSWIVYWLLRFFILEKYFGMQHTYDNSEFGINLPQNLKVFGFKIGWGLEGLWLLVLFAGMILISTKKYFKSILTFSTLFVVILLSLTIYDTTRSTAYTFLILFPALAILKNNIEIYRLRTLLLIIAILCFLHPLATKTNAIGFFLM